MLSRSSYVAEVSKISYGNKQLRLDGLENGHVVFDSGSSYTYFTKQAYADLVATVSSLFIVPWTDLKYHSLESITLPT